MNQSILTNILTPNPPPLIGVPTLATLAFGGSDLSDIADGLLARITENAFDANALMDSAIVLLLRGNPQQARAMQQLAISSQQLYHYPRPATPAKVRVLAIFGPGDLMANSPLEFLLENQPVALDLLYVTPELGLPEVLPAHDVLMVAVGESDQNQALLAQLARELTDWPRPVINHPNRIRQLSRDGVYSQLSKLSGIVIPPTLRVSRETLEHGCQVTSADDALCMTPSVIASEARQSMNSNCMDCRVAHAPRNDKTGFIAHLQSQPRNKQLAMPLPGIHYPVIVRPVDSHAGEGLRKIETPAELAAYLTDSVEAEFFISNFVDYRSADGRFRKCRIMLIDGRAYVSHMAVSSRWMVHYLNADMLASAEHRNEEARFMESFASGFALRHRAALQAIHQQLGLEYVGIDCAETPDGQLLVFEVDSNMVVHNMDPAETFPYKKLWMPKLFSAFTEMLLRHATAG